MKFFANIEDQQYMKEFHNIVITLSKLTKECVLDITAEKLSFIANEEQTATTTAPLVWIEIDVKLYFKNYILDGLTTAAATATATTRTIGSVNNDVGDDGNDSNGGKHHIMLSISPIHLNRALNALKCMARSFKMKLINLQFPCLRIEIDIMAATSALSTSGDTGDDSTNHAHNQHSERQIVHDVPVIVIPRSDWPYYRIPQVPLTRMLIHIKSYRLMKSLIDKLKNISPMLIFEANSSGELCLMAKTEMATITTRYKNLEVELPTEGTDSTNATEIKNQASCSVDCKKAAMFLTALQIPTAALQCSIDDDKLIHLKLNVRSGVVIHSILPALCV